MQMENKKKKYIQRIGMRRREVFLGIEQVNNPSCTDALI